MPRRVASSLRAIAPAATRPIVSRALARPPPCQLRMPYFASVGVVGVRRPVDVLHVLVGRRARVLVAHQQRDRRAERPALEDAREDLDAVGLLARRGEPALAGAAPVEVALDLRDVERRAAAGSRRRRRRRRRRGDSPKVVMRKSVPKLAATWSRETYRPRRRAAAARSVAPGRRRGAGAREGQHDARRAAAPSSHSSRRVAQHRARSRSGSPRPWTTSSAALARGDRLAQRAAHELAARRARACRPCRSISTLAARPRRDGGRAGRRAVERRARRPFARARRSA